MCHRSRFFSFLVLFCLQHHLIAQCDLKPAVWLEYFCSPGSGWPGTHYVAQASAKLMFLSQPLEGWNYICVSPHLLQVFNESFN